jgi:hypothetical protein
MKVGAYVGYDDMFAKNRKISYSLFWIQQTRNNILLHKKCEACLIRNVIECVCLCNNVSIDKADD